MHPDTGKIIAGKYQLRELAGEGGMATVWKGEMHGAAGFTRAVAIKKMKPEFLALRQYIDMFVEEARVGAKMQHANIVQVLDFLQDEDMDYYLILEWVDGINVYELVSTFRKAQHRLPWGIVAAIGIGTLRGLAAAHENRDLMGNLAPIIHRDVSPQNILLSVGGAVKLTDFGLALAQDRIAKSTMPGMVKGKLSYLSPEAVRGGKATVQTDLFAMGTVLWEALAGRRLFTGANDIEVFKKVKAGIIPPLAEQRSGLPATLIEIVHKALSINAEDRFGSAKEFALALSEILGGAKMSQGAQKLMGEAVHEVRRWRSEEARIRSSADPVSKPEIEVPEVEKTKAAWEAVELQFSKVAALPPMQEAITAVDIWFSEAELKLPEE